MWAEIWVDVVGIIRMYFLRGNYYNLKNHVTFLKIKILYKTNERTQIMSNLSLKIGKYCVMTFYDFLNKI